MAGAAQHAGASRPRLHVDHLRPKGEVYLVLEAGAGVNRTGDEFPERIEILERRLARIEIMRRGVVHVGREPHGVADSGALDEREDIGELELAAARRPIVALADRLEAEFAILV